MQLNKLIQAGPLSASQFLLLSIVLYTVGAGLHTFVKSYEVFYLEWFLFLSYFLFTISYAYFLSLKKTEFSRLILLSLIAVGLFFRLMSCFSNGLFEDDFYRYYVEGETLQSGMNPYLVSPYDYGVYLDENPDIPDRILVKSWAVNAGFAWMSGIYPPIVIQIFSYVGSPFSLNLFALGLELLVLLFLLARNLIDRNFALFWWIHPLVLQEAYYNRHYDLWIGLSILLFLCFQERGRIFLAGIFQGLAIHLKGYALIFLPFCSPYILLTTLGSWVCMEWGSYLWFPQRFDTDASLSTFANVWEFNNGLFTGLRILIQDTLEATPEQVLQLRYLFVLLLALWIIGVFLRFGRSPKIILWATLGFFLFTPVNNPWYLLMAVPAFLKFKASRVHYFFCASSLYYLVYLAHDPYYALVFTTPLSLLFLWYSFSDDQI